MKRGLQCDVSALSGPALGVDKFIESGSRSPEKTSSFQRLDGSHELLLSPTAYNEDVYCVFFLDRYFSFGVWNEDLQNNKAWIWSALQCPSKFPVSNLALRSMLSAFCGNANHNKALQRTALELHGETLRALTLAMQDNTKNASFDVLSAIVLLGIYESCHYTSHTAWLGHLSAAKRMFELKGPEGLGIAQLAPYSCSLGFP